MTLLYWEQKQMVVRMKNIAVIAMINHCAQFVDEFNKDSEIKMTKEEAIANMKQFFPQLKRWKANK